MDNQIKCLHCGKQCSKYGIKTHIWRVHGEGQNFNPNKNRIAWNKGLKTPQNIKEKISEGLKGENNPNYGKHLSNEVKQKLSKCGGYKKGSGRGKKGWYKGYWCDSSWELAFVIYNLEHNIKFERNKEKFEYEFNGKHHYTPDFIMEDGIYVEIKGRETEVDIAKYKYFPYKLNVLRKNDLKEIMNYVVDKYGNDFIKLYE